jgi:hypothetical protein
MYTQSWNKYLPVLRILIKRSVEGEQKFKLNIPDFEKIGPGRKTGFKFTLRFNKGRLTDTAVQPQIAKDLSSVLIADPAVNALFQQNQYQISLNSKFQLTIQHIPKPVQEEEPSTEQVQ